MSPKCGRKGIAVLAVVLLGGLTVAGRASELDRARDLLDRSGVKGGLIVHLNCGDGQLTAEFGQLGPYLVQGLELDADRLESARVHIRSLGLYGRVSVDRFDGRLLPYADNLVNLLVADDLGEVPEAEVLRVLSPGGVAMVGPDGNSTKTVKPWPAEIDEWTHYLHDPSNNAVSSDTQVGPPRRYQWIADPRWARSHDHLSTLSALVSTGGRVFYIVDEGPIASVAMEPKWRLVARDAFSGVLLWKRPVGPWEGHLRSFRTGPPDLARRLVAIGDRVYVTLGYGKPITALDAATGETIHQYDETAGTLEMICHNGRLLAVVGDRLPDNTAGAAKPVEPPSVWNWWPIYEDHPPRKHVVALDAASGEVLWIKDDSDTVELMPTTLAAADGRVFFQSPNEILALDIASGTELWRAERAVNRRRPSWSAPTLVVYGDIVLCGDRAVDAPPPDAPETDAQSQWVVNARGGVAPVGQIAAFSASTGERLWDSPCRECYNAPVDILVAGGLVWSGDLVTRRDPGITMARDVSSGEVCRTRPVDDKFFQIVMGHHRCYRNKATEKFLVLGRDGIEFIDVDTGEGFGNAWVRGSCQYGVMPAGGLIYAPPHSCACHIESKLNSFNALAPAGSEPSTGDSPRLQPGQAYKRLPSPGGGKGDEWPTYRHDAARSGQATCHLPASLSEAWKTEIPGGRLTSPVVSGGRLFVAAVDDHVVWAIDAASGEPVWHFIAGGRVDSPPTIWQGMAIFGSADGRVYCLRASDGELVWRYRAAPHDRRIVAYDQLESVGPLHGSVLVLDGVVFAVAGRTPHLDDGLILCRLDAATGRLLTETQVSPPALPDVLSSDGTSIYMRHRRFDLEGNEQPSNVPHLYSPAGFLDDSWWHRTYWLVGTAMGSGWGAWPNSGSRVPAGRLLAVDGETVYGFGRFNQYHRDGTHVGLGQNRYLLYASKLSDAAEEKPGKAARRGAPPAPNVPSIWSRPLPILARGMVLSNQTLFVAGPPDDFTVAPQAATDRYHDTPVEALREAEAALEGKRGGRLMAVSSTDGKTLAEYPLTSPPTWDGLVAAGGRLYLVASDGHVGCMKPADK